MPIQYAGVDLLLEDPGGKLCRWLDHYISVEGMKLFAPPATHIGRDNPRSNVRQFTSLPVPNYPPLPLPKVNALYWPTGAARWGYGLFLTDDEGLDNILLALDAEPHTDGRGNAGLLRIWDEDSDPTTIHGFYLYLLPPRKVSAFDGAGATGLWLLPLVDQRYWWQFLQYDGTIESWVEMIEAIRRITGLGANLDYDSVSDAYGLPHCIEMAREGDSIGLVLDAVAHNIGKRFVLDNRHAGNSSSSSSSSSSGGAGSFGGYRQQRGLLFGPTTAETTLDANLTAGPAAGIIAGGEFSGDHVEMVRPKRVSVIFPDAGKRDVGDTKTATADGAVGGTTKTYHEAADTGVTDDSWRQALADRLAVDLKGWTARLYDITYAGVFDWRPSGFDDYIEWFVGRRKRRGKFQVQTRARSMPYNFGVENLAHQQDEDCPEDDTFAIPYTPCDCCRGCVCYPDDPALIVNGCYLQQYRIVSQEFPFANSQTIVTHVDDNIWESDGFDVVICGINFGNHFWRLTVATGCCTTTLELINDGGTDIPLTYVNTRPFRAFCATEFAFEENCDLYDNDDLKTVAHSYPTKLCVAPVGDTCEPCSTGISSLCCPDGFPGTITATLRDESPSTCVLDGVSVAMAFDSYLGGDTSHPIWIGTYDAGGGCGVLTFRYEVTGVAGGGCDRLFTIKNGGGTTCFSGSGGPQCPMTNHTFGPSAWNCAGCCAPATGVLMYVDITV